MYINKHGRVLSVLFDPLSLEAPLGKACLYQFHALTTNLKQFPFSMNMIESNFWAVSYFHQCCDSWINQDYHLVEFRAVSHFSFTVMEWDVYYFVQTTDIQSCQYHMIPTRRATPNKHTSPISLTRDVQNCFEDSQFKADGERKYTALTLFGGHSTAHSHHVALFVFLSVSMVLIHEVVLHSSAKFCHTMTLSLRTIG